MLQTRFGGVIVAWAKKKGCAGMEWNGLNVRVMKRRFGDSQDVAKWNAKRSK